MARLFLPIVAIALLLAIACPAVVQARRGGAFFGSGRAQQDGGFTDYVRRYTGGSRDGSSSPGQDASDSWWSPRSPASRRSQRHAQPSWSSDGQSDDSTNQPSRGSSGSGNSGTGGGDAASGSAFCSAERRPGPAQRLPRNPRRACAELVLTQGISACELSACSSQWHAASQVKLARWGQTLAASSQM